MSGTLRFDAVLFDCDGVLVDSEPLTMGVLRDMLEERGWRMSLQDCMQIFVGKATKDEAARIERETGQPFTTEWLHRFWARRDVALREHLQAIPGAAALVQQAHALTGGQIACVSGADRDKIGLQLSHTGLLPWFDAPGRRSAATTLVTGHWSALGLKLLPNLLALDSGCLWGGPLTAIRLEDRIVFQVPSLPEEIRTG